MDKIELMLLFQSALEGNQRSMDMIYCDIRTVYVNFKKVKIKKVDWDAAFFNARLIIDNPQYELRREVCPGCDNVLILKDGSCYHCTKDEKPISRRLLAQLNNDIAYQSEKCCKKCGSFKRYTLTNKCCTCKPLRRLSV